MLLTNGRHTHSDLPSHAATSVNVTTTPSTPPTTLYLTLKHHFYRYTTALHALKDANHRYVETDTEESIMTTIKVSPFHAAEYLNSEEAIAEYLSAALEENDPSLFLSTLADVVKARGMGKMAKDADLGRESLYKALAPSVKPRYDTVLKQACADGVTLTVEPLHG